MRLKGCLQSHTPASLAVRPTHGGLPSDGPHEPLGQGPSAPESVRPLGSGEIKIFVLKLSCSSSIYDLSKIIHDAADGTYVSFYAVFFQELCALGVGVALLTQPRKFGNEWQ